MNGNEPWNLAGTVHFDIESLQVVEWHPLPDGQGSPTQVHLVIRLLGNPDKPLILRIKSRVALDALVSALRHHGEAVWPT